MLVGRRLHTKLDLVKPNIRETVLQKNSGESEPRQVKLGGKVNVGDYRNKSQKWAPVVVVARLSPVTYEVGVRINE